MATLILDRVWINLIASGDAVSGFSEPRRTRQYADEGQIRTYGEGRQRSITQVGERGSFEFVFALTVEADITTLRSWKGQLVQVRDHRGRRFYGVFYGVDIVEYPGELDYYTVGISLQFTTYTEGA